MNKAKLNEIRQLRIQLPVFGPGLISTARKAIDDLLDEVERLELRVKELEELAGGLQLCLEKVGFKIKLAPGVDLPEFKGMVKNDIVPIEESTT